MLAADPCLLWLGDHGTFSCGAAACRDRSRGDTEWSVVPELELYELAVLMRATGHYSLGCHCGTVQYDERLRALRTKENR